MKFSNFDDVMNGIEKPATVRMTKALVTEHDKNYERAVELYDYYVTRTRFRGKPTRNSTASAIIKILSFVSYERLRGCIDNYATTVKDPKYAFSPTNFFSRYDADKAYYRDYLPEETPTVESIMEKRVKKIKPRFKIDGVTEGENDNDLLEMPL